LTGKVLELVGDVISPDRKASELARQYLVWENQRSTWKRSMEEVIRYVFATDTTMTSNASLPWKNKTTLPKICQIADNLLSNYILTMFPKQKSIFWQADNEDSNSVEKRDTIESYMGWVISQESFKKEFYKIVSDFVYKGNAIGTVEWTDERVQQPGKTQVGYVGPSLRHLSPLDVVCNPTAESFLHSPKFVRSVMSLGELKKYLNKLTNDENRERYEALYAYVKEIRMRARSLTGDWIERDNMYQIEGFSSFQQYLLSNTVEVLTFYGDYYSADDDEFQENVMVTFVDRHKILDERPNPSYFGYPPIFHCPWRTRPDNIWGMGPLENLLGMQYRIDHMENQKADLMDLSTFPVIKVKGFVEDFIWQPAEKIYVSDEGDVELLQPNIQVQQLVQDIEILQNKMEEMAGAPKEAMGFRSPGEKTKYEVQRLENAASRIFQSKINQFEEFILEPILNAMLEIARRNMSGVTAIPVIDDEFKIQIFEDLTVEDITGVGKIKAIGSRHFAEQAELIQNISGLANTAIWPYIQQHFSSVNLAKLYEEIFDIEEYNIVIPNVAISERADAQRQMQALQEQVHQEAGTATGLGEDHDLPPDQQMQSNQQMLQMAQGQ